MVGEVGSVVVPVAKVGSFWITPWGRITTILVAFLVVYSLVSCVKQNSVRPLFDDLLLRIVNADHNIGSQVDNMNANHDKYPYKSLVDDFRGFWRWLGFYTWFWFSVIVSAWFIGIMLYFLYKVISWSNSSMVFRNWIIAIIIFLVLMSLLNLLYYFPMSVAGKTLPVDQGEIRMYVVNTVHPFSGVRKLVTYLWSSQTFDKVYGWMNSGIGKDISNIPTNNVSSIG